MESALDTLRVDRWLFAARRYKTRSLAQQACAGGVIKVNGAVAAASKALRVGDTVEDGRHVYKVLILDTRRGPAPVARLLFDDLTPPEPEPTEPVALRERGAGRPTKRDRRDIGWLKGE